jgi:hypothetical protein
VSDDLLLFGVGTVGYARLDGTLRAHVPGAGDDSYAVAAGRSPGLFGYSISADGSWLLGAGQAHSDAGFEDSALLYAIRLDGSGENLLSSALLPFWMFEVAIKAFAWSGDGRRAVYIATNGAGLWTSDAYGTSAAKISPGGLFTIAPAGDQVALLEDLGDARQSRLRVSALDTGHEGFSFASDGAITAPSFTPDGRGLLFVSMPTSGAAQLRYASPMGSSSVLLGEWTETLLDMYPGTYGDIPAGKYPVDPTGCFTVVDTDLAPGPGTRLVLLPD